MAQILVVDDSPVVTAEVTDFFVKEGYQISSASDGINGLEQLKNDSGIKLLLVDVNMPNMDGLTMVEKIRKDLNNKAVIVFMLTTENNPSMKERAKAADVKGWIVKPFNGSAIINSIRKMVPIG